MQPLIGYTIVSLAINLPGPVAVFRLRQMGASIIKIEPPGGDPLALASPPFYGQLHQGVRVEQANLKSDAGRAVLDQALEAADLLITSMRPSALARLNLDWPALHRQFPRLSQVAIVGYPAPDQERPGHDLTYQAGLGLLTPPHMPRALVADLGGAELVVSTALGLLLARANGAEPCYLEVALSTAAETFALPVRHGLTLDGGVLGGAWPGYRLFEASDGWLALGALEPHFLQRTVAALGLSGIDSDQMAARFRQQSVAHWMGWAETHDIPLQVVSDGA